MSICRFALQYLDTTYITFRKIKSSIIDVIGICSLFVLLVHDTPLFSSDLTKTQKLDFPITEGTSWNYKITSRVETFEIKYFISSAKIKKSPDGVLIEFAQQRSEKKLSASGVWMVSANEITEISGFPGGAILDPSPIILKLNLKKDDSWSYVGKVRELEQKTDYKVIDLETLKMPFGTCEAWRIQSTHYHSADKPIEINRWFASGIGMVKKTMKDITWELNSYKIEKK